MNRNEVRIKLIKTSHKFLYIFISLHLFSDRCVQPYESKIETKSLIKRIKYVFSRV